MTAPIVGGTAQKVWIAGSDNLAPNSLPVRFGDSASLDGFGRLRISEAVGRFDAQFTYDLQPLLFEQITNGAGATITHDPTNRMAVMKLANSPAGSHAYMQSYKWAHYMPGNAQYILPTCNIKTHTPNVTKFIGYGDRTNNGIHFGSDGVNFFWRILSNTDVGDKIVTQQDWNLDRLDGTRFSPSGVNLNAFKIQIPTIDLQALYSGRVRVGFDIDGVTVYCHEFLHSNKSNFPYIQMATLPVIAGMQCSDTATAEMNFICSTVRSEGAVLESEGFEFTTSGQGTASNGARTHLLSARPKTTFNGFANRTNVVLESIDVLNKGNSPVIIELVFGQSISGTTTFNDVNAAYSAMEFNTAGTISGLPAIVAKTKFVSSVSGNSSISIPSSVSSRYPITLDAAGAVRSLGTVSILGTGDGGDSLTRVALNWREVR